jgi:hypothetical protein
MKFLRPMSLATLMTLPYDDTDIGTLTVRRGRDFLNRESIPEIGGYR